MLRVYGNKQSIKQFWITAQKMKEGGFFIDDHAYQFLLWDFKTLNMTNEAALLTKFYYSMVKDDPMEAVIKTIVGVFTESDSGNGAEKILEAMKLGFQVTDNFLLRVLKDLRKHPLKALAFFRWVSRNLGYEHNTISYNGMLRVLGRWDSIEEFWAVFNEMKSVGHEVDLDTYLKITRSFQYSKMLKAAVELYEHMMDGPYKLLFQDCSMLLRSIVGTTSPDLDLVFRVVNKFESAGNSLSKSVYDGIHRFLTNVSQFDKAEKIMTAMKDAGHEPDNLTYSQLIFGLCTARKLEEASNVINLMESNGCIPDIKTWTILIQGHCSANELEKAATFLANMVEKGCEPDAHLLDVLVYRFLSQEKTIAAHELFTEMVKTTSVKPWETTHKILIHKLLTERKLEESLEVLRLMKKHGYPPLTVTGPFLRYVSKLGTVDDALGFLKTMSFKQSRSATLYQVQKVFRRFLEEGRELEAKDFLFRCPPHVRKHKVLLNLLGSVESSVS